MGGPGFKYLRIIYEFMPLYIKSHKLTASIETDEEFYAFLLAEYEKLKQHEAEVLKAYDGDPDALKMVMDKARQARFPESEAISLCLLSVRNAINMWAVGLFCFGRADVYPDIIDTLPDRSEAYTDSYPWRQAGCLVAVLPLPPVPPPAQKWHPAEHLDAIRSWLDENVNRLEWDENKKVYRLKE